MDEKEQLLTRWQAGDDSVVGDLLQSLQPFVRDKARQLLGRDLRTKVGSDDIVQDAVLEFLRHGPRTVPVSMAQLRALLARIVVSTVCDHGKWWQAARRRLARESGLGSTVLGAVPVTDSGPADQLHAKEMTERLRLAMELLDERDRLLIVWREWEQLPFAQIGQRLELGEEAARSAARRAMVLLGEKMLQLRQGQFDAALAPDRDPPG